MDELGESPSGKRSPVAIAGIGTLFLIGNTSTQSRCFFPLLC